MNVEIGLLLNGVLSDLYGRKLFLILSIMGDCVGNFMQYISTNMIQLILARAFTGLFAGSFILGQAYCLMQLFLKLV